MPMRLQRSPWAVPAARKMKVTLTPVWMALAGQMTMRSRRRATATSITAQRRMDRSICATETLKFRMDWPSKVSEDDGRQLEAGIAQLGQDDGELPAADNDAAMPSGR